MAASIAIEEESGTCSATQRPNHNGYYAGDFSPARRLPTQRTEQRTQARPTQVVSTRGLALAY